MHLLHYFTSTAIAKRAGKLAKRLFQSQPLKSDTFVLQPPSSLQLKSQQSIKQNASAIFICLQDCRSQFSQNNPWILVV